MNHSLRSVIADFTESVEHDMLAVIVNFIEILFGWQHRTFVWFLDLG